MTHSTEIVYCPTVNCKAYRKMTLYALHAFCPECGEVLVQDRPAAMKREHKWTGCRRGGSPSEADSYEWVRYCEVCGMEDTCDDPLPDCPESD